jgi:hypothetical protein
MQQNAYGTGGFGSDKQRNRVGQIDNSVLNTEGAQNNRADTPLNDLNNAQKQINKNVNREQTGVTNKD